MAAIDDLVQSNAAYADLFAKGDLPMPPARGVAVVTCMDARLLPSRFFGLQEGDAHLIRNAGGSARGALTLIELPLVLPPAVAGIGLLAALGPQGLLGGLLGDVGFQSIERRHFEAALALGATKAGVFVRLAVPIARPALLTGLALAWGRALGEFGATLMFAGSFQGITQTVPLAIYDQFASDFPAASRCRHCS
jgi:ABC-type molybdate transport system permease subunit